MPPLSSPDFPSAFAAQWIANRNARDVTARIEGKPALRAYWTAALQKHTSLHFTLDDFAWDAGRRTLAVMYTSRIQGRATFAAELMTFDEQGRQTLGRAYYGMVANA